MDPNAFGKWGPFVVLVAVPWVAAWSVAQHFDSKVNETSLFCEYAPVQRCSCNGVRQRCSLSVGKVESMSLRPPPFPLFSLLHMRRNRRSVTR